MLHARLKTETRPYHDRLDAGLGRLLLRDDLTVARYVGVLGRLHGVVAAWEDAVHAALNEPLPGVLESRRKAPLLAADLAAFNAAPGPAAGPGALPRTDGLTAALGSMYVMEGATLGGRVIAPRVRRSLGLAPGDGGTAYFESYGPDVGRRWREFLDVLERHVPAAGHDAAVAAACATFDALGRWLLVDVVPNSAEER